MVCTLRAIVVLALCVSSASAFGPFSKIGRPAPAPIRMSGGSNTPEKPKVGFLGMGIMGVPMALNLIKAGFTVTVWNRSADKCKPCVQAGAKLGKTPAEVVDQCDITFSMLSDPAAALAVATGYPDVAAVNGVKAGKGYVDCSTVSVDCSQRIAAAVRKAGGMYLEAPVSGSKKPAEDGTLVFLCAGDKPLYDQALPALEKMGKKSVFLGEVGAGAKMKLVVNMVMGSMITALSEGLSLAQHSGLKAEDVFDVLDAGAIANPMFKVKGPLMKKREYPTAFPLKHAQKDMRLAILLADALHVPLPVASAANEVMKHAKALGHEDSDFSAVHAVQHAAGPKAEEAKVRGGTWVVDKWK
mmetsp:Transcript_57655/g.151731  ORF Transcript_57655/g.151731 Transcript_57655/m.151731 type:complete len:356 (+) Transcript_57655:2-1069(+)